MPHSLNVKYHGVGSNQFLSVNIGVIRLLSVITTTPFGSNNKGTLQIFHDFKENCRITMEFSDKVDSIKYSTVP
jgi:hypothetical protein